MCGIFGQITPEQSSSDPSVSIRHRGPDDHGRKDIQVDGSGYWVSLFHRRLSIIDLSSAGHQPMTNEDGTVWLTYNGEVYNFAGLRADLLARGHRFRSKTDTETIIHGYEEWGDDVVKRLHGMFAFALWDSRKSRLLLARDRVGKKPVFYYQDKRSFIFGSEIKALLATGRIATEPDPVAIDDYLTYLYFPPPRTAYKNIWKLPPATCLSVEVTPDKGLQTRQWVYWDAMDAAASSERLSTAQTLEQARTLMEDAVRMRLVSDVPVGIFLSGGIDSSAITALASREGRDSVKTFSIGFPTSKEYDELPYAQMVAQRFKTEHFVLEPDADCAQYMTTVVKHFDEPFGNPTAILEYVLTRLMREHVTVALSGDGGDEVFGGYERYRGAVVAGLYRRFPRFITQGLVPRLAGWIHDDTNGRHAFRRLREFGESAWQDEAEMYLSWVGYFSETEKQPLYRPEFKAQVAGHDSGDFLRGLFRKSEQLDGVNRLEYVDLASFLACNCLEYADRMSMANSLEIRCPFTDQTLIEFALHLRSSFKVHGMQAKWALKKAMEGILPKEILRKKKVGFNPPVPRWLNGQLKETVSNLLHPEVVAARGMFQPEEVSRLVREHAEHKRDNTFKIWALVMLEVWYRIYIDQQPEFAIVPVSGSASLSV